MKKYIKPVFHLVAVKTYHILSGSVQNPSDISLTNDVSSQTQLTKSGNMIWEDME